MPDQPLADRFYGTGALQSPPDERDYQITDLIAAVAPEVAVAPLPAKYTLPNLPPVLDQGNTPMCVAYSSSAMKARQDKLDMGSFYNFDEALFFRLIGGTSSGAVARNALERMRRYGYPVYGVGDAAGHRIAAYYAVPQNISIIKQTITAFGGVLMVGPWFHNWTDGLPASAVLPRPDYGGTGHETYVIGWDDTKGLEGVNSWGTLWGKNGHFWMPYHYVVNSMWELWKARDVKSGPDIPTPSPAPRKKEPMLKFKAEGWRVNEGGADRFDGLPGTKIGTFPKGTLLTSVGESGDGHWRSVLTTIHDVNELVYVQRSQLTPLVQGGDPAFNSAVVNLLLDRHA